MKKIRYFFRLSLIHLYCLFFSLLDSFIPKKRDLWVIASHQGPTGNLRFFVEHLLCTQRELQVYIFSLEKKSHTYLHRTEEYLQKRYGVIFIKKRSFKSLWISLQAGYVLVTHDLIRDVGFPLSPAIKSRMIINLWHGIAMKKHWLVKQYDVLSAHRVRAKQFHHVIASSAADALGKAAIFHKTLDEILVTGLPRNDILLNQKSPLPEDLLIKERELREELKRRTLILYAPTWRGERGFEPIEKEHISSLIELLERYNAVLGLRLHGRDRHQYKELYKIHPYSLNLDIENYPETQILLKNTGLLITDYSSIWIDYLLTRRPIIAYWYDSSMYNTNKGLLWDMTTLFPGEIVYSSSALLEALKRSLEHQLTIDPKKEEQYTFATSFFHRFTQGSSSLRLYKAIEELDREKRKGVFTK